MKPGFLPTSRIQPFRRRRTFRAMLLRGMVLPLLLLSSCRGDPGETGELDVGISIAPTPATIGTSRILISVDDDGAPIAGAEVDVEGNMSHAGMVPVHERAEEIAPGSYAIAAFPFTMAGEWVLTVRVAREGEPVTTRERRVLVVARE